MTINEREKYQRYLCSREWGELRQKVRDRCNGECERCHKHPMDHVHHLTYIRKYNERLEDLQAICAECHEYVHGSSVVDPAKQTNEVTRILYTWYFYMLDMPLDFDFGLFFAPKENEFVKELLKMGMKLMLPCDGTVRCANALWFLPVLETINSAGYANYVKHALVWKQDHNADTFVASPVKLSHLGPNEWKTDIEVLPTWACSVFAKLRMKLPDVWERYECQQKEELTAAST